MTTIPHAEAGALRRDLQQAIQEIALAPDGSFTGVARFGPALVGPPGRLHGGLHAYARLVSVWQALQGELPGPVRLKLDILHPLRLDERCAFTGRMDGNRLETNFLGHPGLSASAVPASAEPPGLRARFAALLEQDEPRSTLMAAGTVHTHIGSHLVKMQASSPAVLDDGDAVARFLPPGEPADTVWICGALDLLGAVVQGFGWRSHVFTVRMDLTVRSAVVSGPVVLLGDRETREDVAVSLPPLAGRGPRTVSVLLADPELQDIHAWGEITLYPARHRLV